MGGDGVDKWDMTQREIKFRAWYSYSKKMLDLGDLETICIRQKAETIDYDFANYEIMQFTGLKDKNGKEIYEGDIVGREGVYHFIEREGWQPSEGEWKIIGEKTKHFMPEKPPERYIAGYKLFEVMWKDESCGFEPFSDSQENCGHCGGGFDPAQFEVIGNIYENPELLVQPTK